MLQKNRSLIIGVTGSFGSGKTTVCNIIEKKYKVYYTDEMAHKVLNRTDIKKCLVSRWGEASIKEGSVDRMYVSNIVFKDKQELDYLNKLIHPQVLKEMQLIVNLSNEKIIFFEVPLLFELGLERCFDFILLIKTNIKTKTNRLTKFSGITWDEALRRLQTQINDAQKSKMADKTIINNQNLDKLEAKITDFINSLTSISYREVLRFDHVMN